MLSKFVSSQILNHGLRLTTRAASAAAQKKPKIERKPEIKHQKVCLSLKINIERFISISLAFY
jgi:hypothetical protein